MYYIPKIFKKLKPSIKKRSHFAKDTACEGGSIILDSSFDTHSYCGYDCKIYCTSVGKYSSIGDNVMIGLQDHRIDLLSSSPCFVKQKDSIKFKVHDAELSKVKQTVIGNDVWIGDRVMIKAGVVLGDGCVVGMGSIVTKDVPPYAIVAGNPAKIIRYRFDEETIKELMKYKWWDLDESILLKEKGFEGNPKVFIEWCKKTNK